MKVATKVFREVVDGRKLDDAIERVTGDVNAFLGTFVQPADVLDVRYVLNEVQDRTAYIVSVIYITGE